MGKSHCRTDNKQWKRNQLSSLPRRDQALHNAYIFSHLDCKIYTASNVLWVRRGPRTTKDWTLCKLNIVLTHYHSEKCATKSLAPQEFDLDSGKCGGYYFSLSSALNIDFLTLQIIVILNSIKLSIHGYKICNHFLKHMSTIQALILCRFENLWRHVISATGTVTDEQN